MKELSSTMLSSVFTAIYVASRPTTLSCSLARPGEARSIHQQGVRTFRDARTTEAVGILRCQDSAALAGFRDKTDLYSPLAHGALSVRTDVRVFLGSEKPVHGSASRRELGTDRQREASFQGRLTELSGRISAISVALWYYK